MNPFLRSIITEERNGIPIRRLLVLQWRFSLKDLIEPKHIKVSSQGEVILAFHKGEKETRIYACFSPSEIEPMFGVRFPQHEATQTWYASGHNGEVQKRFCWVAIPIETFEKLQLTFESEVLIEVYPSAAIISPFSFK